MWGNPRFKLLQIAKAVTIRIAKSVSHSRLQAVFHLPPIRQPIGIRITGGRVNARTIFFHITQPVLVHIAGGIIKRRIKPIV